MASRQYEFQQAIWANAKDVKETLLAFAKLKNSWMNVLRRNDV
ncbi:hypothetical protein [Segetibacter sp.]|jgi:hypothetical protein|nr:hypothetical protein [Segetibacter sp.]MCW3081835.1 hypothetical protein [Segetibacter sp.]